MKQIVHYGVVLIMFAGAAFATPPYPVNATVEAYMTSPHTFTLANDQRDFEYTCEVSQQQPLRSKDSQLLMLLTVEVERLSQHHDLLWELSGTTYYLVHPYRPIGKWFKVSHESIVYDNVVPLPETANIGDSRVFATFKYYTVQGVFQGKVIWSVEEDTAVWVCLETIDTTSDRSVKDCYNVKGNALKKTLRRTTNVLELR